MKLVMNSRSGLHETVKTTTDLSVHANPCGRACDELVLSHKDIELLLLRAEQDPTHTTEWLNQMLTRFRKPADQ